MDDDTKERLEQLEATEVAPPQPPVQEVRSDEVLAVPSGLVVRLNGPLQVWGSVQVEGRLLVV
ncbi:MAG: hypothetical protein HC837_20500 [Chloroflexaceae bacterium]|nr:hypothetical protein [Chloroflexaceae bacterium]